MHTPQPVTPPQPEAARGAARTDPLTTGSDPVGTATTPATMRAVVQDRYGSADELRLAEIPVPRPGAGEVLVQVAAAGVDSGTWHIMTGTPYLARLALGLRRPKRRVPGLDLAGTVVAVGTRVERFAVGDEVFGIGTGSFAEYTVALERKLAHRPAMLAAHDAAAVPVSGLTALHAVRDVAGVQPGHRVLVIGASGGVGSHAVQIAVALGGEVTGVCSAGKSDLVRSLGATEAIDRSVPRWWQPLLDRGVRFDAVIDIAGRLPVRVLRRLTTPTGSLVFVGGEGGGPISGGMGRQLRGVLRGLVSRQRITMLIAKEDGAGVADLGQMIEEGRVVPSVGRVFPLAEAAEALRMLERGEVRGKLVIDI